MNRFVRVGVTLFTLSAGSAYAGGKGHWHDGSCDNGQCPTEVIQLPAQRVVVETSRPRVIVEEARVRRHHGRSVQGVAVQPFVATPMFAGPMMAMVLGPTAFASPTQEVRTPPTSPLRAIHELEEQTYEINRLRAIQEAEIKETARALQRASETLQVGMKSLSGPNDLAVNSTMTGDQALQVGNRLGQLESENTTLTGDINSLSADITKLKTLISYHDEALKQVQANNDSDVVEAVEKLTERIEKIEKLISIHDELLREKPQS